MYFALMTILNTVMTYFFESCFSIPYIFITYSSL